MVRGNLAKAIGLYFLAPTVIIALLGCSNTAGNEKLTIYQDAPAMNLLDLGASGNSLGDAYYFSANLHSAQGGPVVGEVFGSKTLVKMSTADNPNAEQRMTLLFFTFDNREDQIMVAGVPDYPPDAGEFAANQKVLRAILGGTGKYIGARGQLESTRNADGTYTQVFSLLK